MRRIHFAGGSFITGDGEATVICEYAATLANSGRSATLTLPALDEAGQREMVELVVGPASQLLAEAVDLDALVPETGDFIAQVRAEIDRITWNPPSAGSFIDDL